MALDFTNQNPRLIATLALAADTVLSLKDAIIAALSAATAVRDLFADAIAADEAARLLLTEVTTGFTVYQTDNTTFYLLTNGADPTVADNWTALDAADNVRALHSFLNNISWKIKLDSSIGNETGGGDLYLMTKFSEVGAVPDSAIITAYGVEIAVGTERTCSGYASHCYVYSLAGTNLVLDIVFEPGG